MYDPMWSVLFMANILQCEVKSFMYEYITTHTVWLSFDFKNNGDVNLGEIQQIIILF